MVLNILFMAQRGFSKKSPKLAAATVILTATKRRLTGFIVDGARGYWFSGVGDGKVEKKVDRNKRIGILSAFILHWL